MRSDYFANQLAFYGAYHSVLGNQVVHLFCVPLSLIFGTSLGHFILPDVGYFLLIVWCLMYPVTYIYLDVLCGISWIPMAVASWLCAEYVHDTFSALSVLLMFVSSMGIQILSHYWIEHRKPAFVDSLYQSFVLAPLFVWMEFVIFPLGFHQDLHRDVNLKIKKLQAWMN